MWRLCPETTTGWLGPSPGLRGEKRRLLQIFFSRLGSTHAYNSGKAWTENNRLTKSGWQITKNIFPLLNNEFQRVFLVLIESSKPKNIANFTERSAHIIRHCCWHLLSWLARTPRAVILVLFELNCDWLRIPTSQKSFSGASSQTLFSAEPSNSRKYVCVRRLGRSRSGRLITSSVYIWVSEWHICISKCPQECRRVQKKQTHVRENFYIPVISCLRFRSSNALWTPIEWSEQ